MTDSKPDYTVNTFVFKGNLDKDKNAFAETFLGAETVQWSLGNALDEKEQLEDFIRSVAFGEVEDPKKAAIELMDKMRWG